MIAQMNERQRRAMMIATFTSGILALGVMYYEDLQFKREMEDSTNEIKTQLVGINEEISADETHIAGINATLDVIDEMLGITTPTNTPTIIFSSTPISEDDG